MSCKHVNPPPGKVVARGAAERVSFDDKISGHRIRCVDSATSAGVSRGDASDVVVTNDLRAET